MSCESPTVGAQPPLPPPSDAADDPPVVVATASVVAVEQAGNKWQTAALLAGVRVARNLNDVLGALSSLSSEAAFALGEGAVGLAGEAARRAASADATPPVLVPSLRYAAGPLRDQIAASLSELRKGVSATLELTHTAASHSLAAGESLLSSAPQLELLRAALPKVLDVLKRGIKGEGPGSLSDVSAVSLLHALYTLSLLQAEAPIDPSAAAACDGLPAPLATADASPGTVPLVLSRGDAAELRRMAAFAVGAYGGGALALLRGASFHDSASRCMRQPGDSSFAAHIPSCIPG